MTGPEHFRRAEELAAEAHKLRGQATDGPKLPAPGSDPACGPRGSGTWSTPMEGGRRDSGARESFSAGQGYKDALSSRIRGCITGVVTPVTGHGAAR